MARLTLDLVGDVNLKRDGGLSPEKVFGLVDHDLDRADVRLGNLEGPFFDPAIGLTHKPGWMNVEPEMVDALQGRFDAVACANNVTFGEAIGPSLAGLDRLGIGHTGAGIDRAAAHRPAVVEHGGQRIGVLAYTSVFTPHGQAATDTEPGVATIRAVTAYEPHPRVHEMPGAPAIVRSRPDEHQLAAAVQDVRELADQVDLVVVYCHWGVSASPQPAEYQGLIGRALIDAGARLVVGAHPHTLQGIERYRGGAIFHSLGNFVYGDKGLELRAAKGPERDAVMGPRPEPMPDQTLWRGMVARVVVEDGVPVSVSLLPVQPGPDDQPEILGVADGEGRRIIEVVARLSARLGTEIDVDHPTITLDPVTA